MVDIIKGTKIYGVVNPGDGQTVATHRWLIDGVVVANQGLVLDTINMDLGQHTVELTATNSCGNTGITKLTINILQGDKMQQTDPIIVNKPEMLVTVYLRRTSTITITVLDDPNGPNPNTPINGATVDISGKSGTTDSTGKVTLKTIPFGNNIITTTFT